MTLSRLMEPLKKIAAEKAVIENIKNGYLIGIGSGTTIKYAVNKIASFVKEHGWSVKCVPTSFQAKQLIVENHLPLVTLEEYPELDVALDGADEVDHDMTLIKGGGGCMLQEKVVDTAAKRFVVIADESKRSSRLGEKWKRGIPIEVVPMAYKCVQLQILNKWGGETRLREAMRKMGPVVTDNGNFILDWNFDMDRSYDWRVVDMSLHLIPGVVETGLFVDVASVCYFGRPDGEVVVVRKPHSAS